MLSSHRLVLSNIQSYSGDNDGLPTEQGTHSELIRKSDMLLYISNRVNNILRFPCLVIRSTYYWFNFRSLGLENLNL